MVLHTFTEDVLEAPADEIVCWCSRVTKKTLLDAIRNGVTELAAIRAATKACTLGQCKEMSPRRRCCSQDIQKLIANHTNKEEVAS